MNFPPTMALRSAGLAVGFLFGLTCVIGLVMLATRAASLEPGASKLENLGRSEAQINVLAGDAQVDEAIRIAFLGDSTVHSAARKKGLPFLLGQRLEASERERLPAKVYSLASPALGSISFHALSRDIIAASPDLIVWQVAFSHSNDFWLRGNTHHEFSGRLSLQDLVELSVLPIHQIDLSFDDLLAYKILLTPSIRPLWSGLLKEQSRVQKARSAFEKTLPGKLGRSPEVVFAGVTGLNQMADQFVQIDGRSRHSKKWAIEYLGEGLRGINTDHIVLQVLAKSLSLFRDAQIPVVIYLNPINIDYLRSLGTMNEELLQASIEAYRSVATRYSAGFVDLHDELPDVSFYDAQGHFKPTPELDPAARILERIQPAVNKELDRITKARAAEASRTRAESGS